MTKMYQKICFSLINNKKKDVHKLLRQRFYSSKALKQSDNRNEWHAAIGLEVHAQIATDSKLFSAASTNFNSPVNSNVSFFDCSIPGTLPVLNRKCVELGVLTALALSCNVNRMSSFERKHYFYPDLPAGFQITQHREPLASNGKLSFLVYTPGIHKEPYPKCSRLKQIQLEQDSGKSLYDENSKRTLIDLNRAGIPLMEFVFEPDLIDGEEAAALVKELALILKVLGACSCKMEEGAFRVDANVSVSKEREILGVRTEIKNIYSTRAVAAAINSEINRQISILESGGEVVNETRGWDAETKSTISMRQKEDRQDYRFMPETNLPPLYLHVDESARNDNNLVDVPLLKKQLPELPEETRRKFQEKYDFPLITIITITSNQLLLHIFSSLMETNKTRNPKMTAIFLLREVLHFLNNHKLDLEFCTDHIAFIGETIDLIQSQEINYLIAREVLNMLITSPEKMPRQIVQENDWFVINDEKELEKICMSVLEQNPKAVKQYKSGKKKVFKFFVKEVIRCSNKRANMSVVPEIMEKLLS